MKSDKELYDLIETEVKSIIENLTRAYEDLITGCIRLKAKLTPEEIKAIFEGSTDKKPLLLKYIKSEEIIQKRMKEMLGPTKEEEVKN